VAHYTTPTNIGLFLVSTLSAYDLGYIGLLELAVRLRSTFESIDKMEHYRGHLMNWYDSQTLAALPPRYVSTVDSGNLAACLITLKQGCLASDRCAAFGRQAVAGVARLLDILAEVLQALEKNNPHASIESFEVELTSIYERVSAVQNQAVRMENDSRLALRRRLGKSLASIDGIARESSPSPSANP
jgi:cyclic beta-1,2-glucan synthetase